jgi:hypothetical protein
VLRNCFRTADAETFSDIVMNDLYVGPGEIADAASRCRALLASPELKEIPALLADAGVGISQVEEVVLQTAHAGLPLKTWDAMAQACENHGIPESSYALQRHVLLSAGMPNLARIAHLPIADEVKRRLLDQFLYLCDPDREMAVLLNPRHYGFRVMCKFMRLERFPAGQSDWEISGFPRSWLAKMPLRDLARALNCVYLRAGRHRPYFETHTAHRRESPILTPEDERRTYRLMAASMRLQPAIRGYLGASWLLDPRLAEVSPHLAWMSAWYRECERFGAIWTTIGEAQKDAGFLVGDPNRRRLYERGQWKPLKGLLLWARRDLLAWYDWDRTQEGPAGE